MDIYYCIFNVFKKKLFGGEKYLGTVNYFFMPFNDDRHIMFRFFGTFDNNIVRKKVFNIWFSCKSSAAQQVIDTLVNGNSGRFKVLEKLPCKVSFKNASIPEIILSKKGKFLKGNLKVEYANDISNSFRMLMYFIDGEYNFIQGPVDSESNSNVKNIAGNIANLVTKNVLQKTITSFNGLTYGKP